jgi:hypothetical protein
MGLIFTEQANCLACERNQVPEHVAVRRLRREAGPRPNFTGKVRVVTFGSGENVE